MWGSGVNFLKVAFALGYSKELAKYKISSPHTYVGIYEVMEETEVTRLNLFDTQALSEVQNLAKELDVGAILLEVVLGPFRVYFFSPAFLTTLKKVCSDLGILVVCNEVLEGDILANSLLMNITKTFSQISSNSGRVL
jgi:glutamate-1-semialdehyde aminotransferase